MLKPRYRIYGRRQVEIDFKWTWGSWYFLGSTNTQEEAEASVSSWKLINPKRHDYKFNLESSEFPELDPYYKSAEFVKLGES